MEPLDLAEPSDGEDLAEPAVPDVDGPGLTHFVGGYPFGLDDFQRDACRALEVGLNVLVGAPTGAGKTVVGEFAAHLALAGGRKCFYTTPIKALSNQKYADLVRRHGAPNVGLLTGDTAVNGDAAVVVMTTEVLRNMLYARSPALQGLGYVVMDEVHYLADRFRGAVWEEVIIHLSADVRLVSLSATVSNAEEFGAWLQAVRGATAVVLSEHRPVPLWQHVVAGHRMHDLFLDEDQSVVNPALLRLAQEDMRFGPPRGGGGAQYRRGGQSRFTDRPQGLRTPQRAEVVERLSESGLLPAIFFVFSRAGCDAAVGQCLRAGLRLTGPDESARIRAHVEARTADLADSDLAVLGYFEFLEGLERGIAAHHAGMLPTFKEIVEELFVQGLVRAVFATETLALGINMPARSVVLEKLTKWNGETHADITPGEYTQLTGRAGRRGIDVEGHAVVLWQPGLDPNQVAGLASTRTYPLRSSFRPTYNMAVNLVDTVGRERARELLESSFAQFQADRSVVGLSRQLRRTQEAIRQARSGLATSGMDPELVRSYDALRKTISAREKTLAREGQQHRRSEATDSLARLRVGDIISVPAGRRAGLAVVLDPGLPTVAPHAVARGLSGEGPRPLVLTADRQAKRLSLVDFPEPVVALGRVRVPRTFNSRSPQDRRDLAATLRQTPLDEAPERRRRRGQGEDDELLDMKGRLRAHPLHGSNGREDLLRRSDRLSVLEREEAGLQERMSGRTGVIATTFDRVCRVLDDLGYLREDASTDAGRMLARVYAESDLLVAECVRRAVWDALTPPQLAAVVSSVVYESRRAEDAPAQGAPPSVRLALAETHAIWARLSDLEGRSRLATLRPPDVGFTWAAYRWAAGSRLDEVLIGAELTAGDFVRWVRQLLDLLTQVGGIAPAGSPLPATARAARDALTRGVVAYAVAGTSAPGTV